MDKSNTCGSAAWLALFQGSGEQPYVSLVVQWDPWTQAQPLQQQHGQFGAFYYHRYVQRGEKHTHATTLKMSNCDITERKCIFVLTLPPEVPVWLVLCVPVPFVTSSIDFSSSSLTR